MTPTRRRPSETVSAWAPPRTRDDDAAASAEQAGERVWISAGEPSGGAPPRRGRGRLAVVALIVVALVAGARLAGVDLPEATPPAPITVDRAGEADAAPGGLPGSDPRVVDPRSGEVVPRHGDDPAAGVAESLSATPMGHWRQSAAAPIEPRADATALWAGECGPDAAPPTCGVAVLWGGVASASGVEVAGDGALYDPAADRWWPIPEAPIEATSPLPAVWADGRLFVWGGVDPAGLTGDADATRTATGAVYDPRRGNWEKLRPPPISGRTGHVLAWAGGEVIVWGGGRRGVDGAWIDLDDGAAYHPERGTWRVLPLSTLPARSGAAAVALGHRVVVWGGRRGGGWPDGGANLRDGAVLDTFLNTWTPLPEVRAQPVRDPGEPLRATLLGEGDRVLLAAPFVVPWRRPVYATYQLGDRRWRLVDPPGGQLWRGAAVRGDPDRIVVWGGRQPRRPRPDGAVGVIRGPAWPLPEAGQPSARGQAVVWTGDTLVVWGGENRVYPRALVWSARPPPGQQVAFPPGWP